MPMASIRVSKALDAGVESQLAEQVSASLSRALGKPEAYVMVSVESATMRMAGSFEPCAFVDVRSIGGLEPGANGRICAELCGHLEAFAGVKPKRVYAVFANVPASSWGWNRSTFG